MCIRLELFAAGGLLRGEVLFFPGGSLLVGEIAEFLVIELLEVTMSGSGFDLAAPKGFSGSLMALSPRRALRWD